MPLRTAAVATLAAFLFLNQALGAQESAAPQGQPSAPSAAPAPLDMSPRAIYQKEGPAVLLILCLGANGRGELGTGSVIDGNGHIITNAHVVVNAATGQPYETIHAYFKPAHLTGDSQKDMTDPKQARVVRFDRKLDLALLQLEGKPSRLSVMPVGDSDRIEAGEPVVAIGHPEQGGLWTLTTGVVSTVIANLGDVPGKDVFQTDASINRGNSGGPLIDRRGEMIGINTSIARKAEDGLAITSVNFSIKSDVVKKWLSESGSNVALTEAPPQNPAAAAAEQASAKAPQAAAEAAKPDTKAEAAPAKAEAAPAKAEAPSTKPEAAPAKPEAAPAKMVTPARPYKIEDVIEKEMAEMEDLEKEMRQEIEKRRGGLNAPEPEQHEEP